MDDGFTARRRQRHQFIVAAQVTGEWQFEFGDGAFFNLCRGGIHATHKIRGEKTPEKAGGSLFHRGRGTLTIQSMKMKDIVETMHASVRLGVKIEKVAARYWVVMADYGDHVEIIPFSVFPKPIVKSELSLENKLTNTACSVVCCRYSKTINKESLIKESEFIEELSEADFQAVSKVRRYHLTGQELDLPDQTRMGVELKYQSADARQFIEQRHREDLEQFAELV